MSHSPATAGRGAACDISHMEEATVILSSARVLKNSPHIQKTIWRSTDGGMMLPTLANFG